MTYRDLYTVKQGIDKCDDLSNPDDLDFSMTIARINSEISAELKIVNAGKRPISDKYKEYLKKKEELDMKYSIQKEDGTLQMLNGNVIIRTPTLYHNDISKLNKEYKKELDNFEKQVDEFDKFLDTECKTVITKLKKSCIPASIKVGQYKLLFPVIE